MHKILIIDDEDKIRDMYLRLLTQAGFIVRSVSNAQQATSVLVREPIDLILLDIKMPRVDGRSLFDVIACDHAESKVIVSSVYPIDKQKEMIPNATNYYDKSEGPLSLLERINATLGVAH